MRTKFFGLVFVALFLFFPRLSISADPRIIGGTPVIDGDFPWIVSLQESNGTPFCGGSLLDKNWIVTAAHCVRDSQRTLGRIVVGRPNLTNTSAGLTITSFRIYIHPDYVNVSSGNDIALIYLPTPIPTSIVSEFASLAKGQLYEEYVQTGDLLTIIGWGSMSEGGDGSNQLMETVVPIVSDSACAAAYAGQGIPITSSHLCAGFVDQGGQDSCQGDSGGPLFFNYGSTAYIAGITSFGIGCARPEFPGIYADINVIGDWLTIDYDQPVFLFANDQTAISYSQNWDNDKYDVVSWIAPPEHRVRFEYRIDYSSRSDVNWTHYATYPAGQKQGTLSYKVGSMTSSQLPKHPFGSTSRFYNPNHFVKLHYRVRLEAPNWTGQWRYMRPIWVYFND